MSKKPHSAAISSLNELFFKCKRYPPLIPHYLQMYCGSDYARYTYSTNLFNKSNVFTNEKLSLHVIMWLPGHNTKLHNHPSDSYYKVISGELYDYSCPYSIRDSEFHMGEAKLDIVEEGAVAHTPQNTVHMISTYEQSISVHIQLLTSAP